MLFVAAGLLAVAAPAAAQTKFQAAETADRRDGRIDRRRPAALMTADFDFANRPRPHLYDVKGDLKPIGE